MIVQTVMQLWSSAATLLHHIRSIFRQEGESFWQSKAEAIDTKRPDALSNYNAIREMLLLNFIFLIHQMHNACNAHWPVTSSGTSG